MCFHLKSMFKHFTFAFHMTPHSISILLLLIQNMSSTKPVILMLGINNSGKTQFVESLCGNLNTFWMPTISCTHQDYSRFFIRDPINQEVFRGFREGNYLSADGIIFVISLLDFHYRINEVKQALIEASVNTGNQPFTIVINQRVSLSYDVFKREEFVRSLVQNWWKVITWLMNLNDRCYTILSCDVEVEEDVKECFDKIQEFF